MVTDSTDDDDEVDYVACMISYPAPTFFRRRDAPGEYNHGRNAFIGILIDAMHLGATQIEIWQDTRRPSKIEENLPLGIHERLHIPGKSPRLSHSAGFEYLFEELKKHTDAPFLANFDEFLDEKTAEFYPSNFLGEELWESYRASIRKHYEVSISVQEAEKRAKIDLRPVTSP